MIRLIAALGIPRAYLTFEDMLGGKTTLAQEDIRFARTIQRVQKLAISELNKIAMIHLFAKGYDNPDDLTDFKLHLSNPSTINEMQKLELFNQKFMTYTTAIQSAGIDREYAQRKILRLTSEEVKHVNLGILRDSKFNAEALVVSQKVQQASSPKPAGGEEGQEDQSQGGQKPGEPLAIGQQPLDLLPGGQAAATATQSKADPFKNTPGSPMSMSKPAQPADTGLEKNKDKKIKEDDVIEKPEEMSLGDLFDPNDKDDNEILQLDKKYSKDWLSKNLNEQAKISAECKKIFINMQKHNKQGKK